MPGPSNPARSGETGSGERDRGAASGRGLSLRSPPQGLRVARVRGGRRAHVVMSRARSVRHYGRRSLTAVDVARLGCTALSTVRSEGNVRDLACRTGESLHCASVDRRLTHDTPVLHNLSPAGVDFVTAPIRTYQPRPSGAKRSPSFSTRRKTSVVSNRSRRGSSLAAHRRTSAALTGVDTVGVDMARTE